MMGPCLLSHCVPDSLCSSPASSTLASLPILAQAKFILPKSLSWSRASNTLTWAFCMTDWFLLLILRSQLKGPKEAYLDLEVSPLSLPSPSVVSFTANVSKYISLIFVIMCNGLLLIPTFFYYKQQCDERPLLFYYLLNILNSVPPGIKSTHLREKTN